MIQIAPHLIRPERIGVTTRRMADEFEEYNEMMDFEEKEAAVEHMLTGESPPEGGTERSAYYQEREELEEELPPQEAYNQPQAEAQQRSDLSPGDLDPDNGGGAALTKTVRFGTSLEAATKADTLFSKEDVVPTHAFSLMTQTLAERGLLNADNFSDDNQSEQMVRLVPMKVFLAVGQPPKAMKVKESCTCLELIELVLEKCAKEGKPLPHPLEAYELRLTDDDDDGTPDEDIAALDMGRNVHKYAASALAMCVKEDWVEKSNKRGRGDTQVLRGNQVKLNSSQNSRAFIRVFIDAKQSYVLKTSAEMTLLDCLPLIAKKKQVDPSQIPAEMYNFIYYGDDQNTAETIPMTTPINSLASDTLQFVRKVPATKGITIEAKATYYTQHQFNFDIDSAGAYCEYRVIKTNRKGKNQARVLGIDRENIHNKVSGASSTKKFLGLKKADVDKVSHPLRPVTSIVKCDLDHMPHPGEEGMYFLLTFKEDNGKEKELLYKGETKIDVAEIIAKVQYLKQWHQERKPQDFD
eukprot:gb/GEZN01004512.1/.p1 GENE.gb/GEZN01004512.1/~~gb/GEZN01004512.1/.p1  ORF type:complete len:555 (+),score=113.60 gb/GEZN01004512.1/:97-1665(+)